eukprot:2957235-Rhodomonas_salina.1
MGTALKILLLPEQLIAASLTRPELVALFNTLHKFSNAIQKVFFRRMSFLAAFSFVSFQSRVPELSAMYQAVQMSYKSSILEEATPRIAGPAFHLSHPGRAGPGLCYTRCDRLE